jgi:hypothetical protein
MSTATPITSVGTTKRRHFVSQEMLTSRTAATASAIHSYLVNEVAFFHKNFLSDKSKFLQIGHVNAMTTRELWQSFFIIIVSRETNKVPQILAICSEN